AAVLGLLVFAGLLSLSATGGATGARAPLTAAPAGVTQGATYAISKTPGSGGAQTDPSLLGRTDTTPPHPVIQYDFPARASYGGGICGLRATSPRVTHKTLQKNTAAVAAYQTYAKSQARQISADIEKTIPDASVIQTFTMAYGGAAATVPANQIENLL